MATALQAEASHPVGADAEAVHPTRMRSKVRPDTVERALDPRIYVIWMQIVQEQQALDQRICEQAVTDRGPGRPFGLWLRFTPGLTWHHGSYVKGLAASSH